MGEREAGPDLSGPLPGPAPIPLDYDRDPDRFRTGRDLVREHGTIGDIHEPVAARLIADGLGPVLDVGCGDGVLGRLLRRAGVGWVGLDLSTVLLADAPRPAVRGDAAALPFPAGGFGAVTALWMLYHLPAPERAIREAHRVLRPGGLFVAAAPSRFDSPELRHLLPAERPATFDAEVGPDLVRGVFPSVEVDAWDGPYLRLPDVEALRRYLVGKGVDRASAAERAASAARDGSVTFPLAVTKRGALVYGRK